MKNTIIEKTKYTPNVVLDSSGLITIVGKSYPENGYAFYAPIIKWLKQYLADATKTHINLEFEVTYCNSSSLKFFYDILNLINNSQKENTVKWIYDEENEVSEEIGEEFIEDFEELNIVTIMK